MKVWEVKDKKNMTKQQNLSEDDEIEILSKQLDSREMYMISFLKGFDRKILKEWGKKGLMDFAIMQ